MRYCPLAAFAVLFFLPLFTAFASLPDAPDIVQPGPIHPVFITTPPVIDGKFDEPFWSTAPHVGGFKTYAPDFDIVPKEQTEVAMAYDKDNLYFAFRCYDDPSKIKASVAARDKMISDDWVCINLDAFNDQQSLTAFYINPFGIQGDSRFTAGNEDFSPDFVWYSAGKIDSAGYTVEVQLPLKSLRYSTDDPTSMGVILERYIARRSEHSTFPRMDPAKGGAILTEMYPLSYSGIEHYKLVELLPTVTATRQDARQGTTLEKLKQESEASLTLKYGITSDLIADATINPDFSQVESDAGQVDVNLRYSVYYPEKRPFFLEGLDNFSIGANANLFDPTIYYSRRIADPFIGGKLTGKLGNGNTIAALYAIDNVLEADRPALGRYVHVPVLRYRRTLSNDSYVGFLYAGRELDQTHNRVVGYDEQYRLSTSGVLESNGFLSWAKGDPKGSEAAGNTFGARYFNDSRSVSYSLSFRELSENFRANMGYVTRTGLVNFIEYLNPRIFPDSKFFQRIGFELILGQTKDRPSGLWETSNDLACNLFFAGDWYSRVRLNNSTEVFAGQRFQTSGVHAELRAQFTREIFADVIFRRIRAIYYDDPQQGKSSVVNATLTLQPSDNLRCDGSFIYSDITSDATSLLLYREAISRLKLTYQVNQYLFFRAISQYNNHWSELQNDLLASFTYIPGTAFYIGYGSIFDRVRWSDAESRYTASDGLLEMQRGLFMKMSYLWRS